MENTFTFHRARCPSQIEIGVEYTYPSEHSFGQVSAEFTHKTTVPYQIFGEQTALCGEIKVDGESADEFQYRTKSLLLVIKRSGAIPVSSYACMTRLSPLEHHGLGLSRSSVWEYIRRADEVRSVSVGDPVEPIISDPDDFQFVDLMDMSPEMRNVYLEQGMVNNAELVFNGVPVKFAGSRLMSDRENISNIGPALDVLDDVCVSDMVAHENRKRQREAYENAQSTNTDDTSKTLLERIRGIRL